MRPSSSLPLLAALIALLGAGCAPAAMEPTIRTDVLIGPAPTSTEPLAPAQPAVVVERLQIPWDIAFLPDGDWLVTERPGTLRRIHPSAPQTVTRIEVPGGTATRGEGGLLGIALHPDFAKNGWLYLYRTVGSVGRTTCQIDRFRLDGDRLVDQKTILSGIPGAIYHDGGRLAFGPDKKLYVTTGDATDSDSAQDLQSLGGKILRLNDDGSIPTDNPFQSAVWSYGHRNPQGLVWDGWGMLWSTEHGRSGNTTGYDELNRIEKGKNYGWPKIQGPESVPGMESPIVQSGPGTTWAPGGAALVDNRIVFGGLRGEAVYVFDTRQSRPRAVKAMLQGVYGRIRTVAVGPDGFLYLLTSNTDGRGKPTEADDRIIRVDPKAVLED